MSLKHIIVSFVLFIACLAVYIISRIRNRQGTSNSMIARQQDEDFIDQLSNKKRRKLEKNPWAIKYETYKTIALAAAISIAGLTYILTDSFLLSLLFSFFGLMIPELIVKIQTSRQQSNYEDRYAVGLRQLVAGLKSGLSIQQSVSDVCISPFVHDSIKQDFQMIDADLKLGSSVRQAFQNFADRVSIPDAQDVAIAIAMQDEVGGQEAKVIESIAKNISDRIMLRKEIKSMFAGSSATIVSMDIIPFAVVILIYILAPSYLSPFFTDSLMMMVFIALLIFMGIGSIVIHKNVDKSRKRSGL